MSYSFGVKGLYAGITLDGTVLVPRKDCNNLFYGENTTLEDIIGGKVETPDNEDYQSIVKLLEVNSRISGKEKGHQMDPDDLTPLSTHSDDIDNDQQNAEDVAKDDSMDISPIETSLENVEPEKV